MRSRFSGVFQAGSVKRTGCSAGVHRITSFRTWVRREGTGLKSATARRVQSIMQTRCTLGRRTHAIMYRVRNLHVFSPDRRPILTYVQLDLLRRFLGSVALFASLPHLDISVCCGLFLVAIRGGYNCLRCIVPRVSCAYGRRSDVDYQGRDLIYACYTVSSNKLRFSTTSLRTSAIIHHRSLKHLPITSSRGYVVKNTSSPRV